jgi:integrase
MMDMGFRSILKDELVSFMAVLKLSISNQETFRGYLHTLSEFDSFLFIENLATKKLDPGQIKRWVDRLDVQPSTKSKKLAPLRRFARYLSALGIEATLPELPRMAPNFLPYVFTADEIAQIFEAADDLSLTSHKSRKAAEFPVLLRMLYGCGFRIGEVTSMTWDDVDLSTGVITVKAAKNQKQRLVPMSDELTRILTLYRAAPLFNVKGCNLLFKKNDGGPHPRSAFWSIFDSILSGLGIKNPQNAKHRSRGPCIHSLRHTFALHSLVKAEAEGLGFMETVPFLSTYLGHAGLMETDKYLKARHELYTKAHSTIADYTSDVFPTEV